jgi:hypothetical protein|tara:strand:+ start:14588 stop:15307 length:720 start_codon:yes stop_codon:yes gene_type:complete
MLKTIILTTLAAVGFASADITVPPIEVSSTYRDTDIWRGAKFGESDKVTGLSTGYDFDFARLEASFSYADNSQLNNTNLSVGFTRDFSFEGVGEFTAGVVYKHYTGGTDIAGDVTSEIGVSIAKEFSFADVSGTQYFATEGDGLGYFELTAKRSINPFPFVQDNEVFIDLTATVGYSFDESEFTHSQLTFSKDYDLDYFGGITLTPFASLVNVASDTAGTIYAGSDDETFTGISFSKSF